MSFSSYLAKYFENLVYCINFSIKAIIVPLGLLKKTEKQLEHFNQSCLKLTPSKRKQKLGISTKFYFSIFLSTFVNWSTIVYLFRLLNFNSNCFRKAQLLLIQKKKGGTAQFLIIKIPLTLENYNKIRKT